MHIDDHGMELKKILSYLTLLISFPVADFAGIFESIEILYYI